MAEEKLNLDDRLRRKMGRASREYSLATRFTKDETDQLAKAAARQGKTVREWSREVLLREARFQQGDPLFTEMIATRVLLNIILRTLACGVAITAEEYANVLTNVRATKRQAAQEVMEQYTATTRETAREEHF